MLLLFDNNNNHCPLTVGTAILPACDSFWYTHYHHHHSHAQRANSTYKTDRQQYACCRFCHFIYTITSDWCRVEMAETKIYGYVVDAQPLNQIPCYQCAMQRVSRLPWTVWQRTNNTHRHTNPIRRRFQAKWYFYCSQYMWWGFVECDSRHSGGNLYIWIYGWQLNGKVKRLSTDKITEYNVLCVGKIKLSVVLVKSEWFCFLMLARATVERMGVRSISGKSYLSYSKYYA